MSDLVMYNPLNLIVLSDAIERVLAPNEFSYTLYSFMGTNKKRILLQFQTYSLKLSNGHKPNNGALPGLFS